jgi:hypothetical protein
VRGGEVRGGEGWKDRRKEMGDGSANVTIEGYLHTMEQHATDRYKFMYCEEHY